MLTLEFDASIDLLARDILPGMPVQFAVQSVIQTLEALPGAAWISVEHYRNGFVPPGAENLKIGHQISVWRRGGSAPLREDEDGLSHYIRAPVLQALEVQA